MKGRNTTCITLRLDDNVVQSLQERALKQGMRTPGEYIKAQILRSLDSDVATNGGNSSNPSEITTKVIGGVTYRVKGVS